MARFGDKPEERNRRKQGDVREGILRLSVIKRLESQPGCDFH